VEGRSLSKKRGVGKEFEDINWKKKKPPLPLPVIFFRSKKEIQTSDRNSGGIYRRVMKKRAHVGKRIKTRATKIEEI